MHHQNIASSYIVPQDDHNNPGLITDMKPEGDPIKDKTLAERDLQGFPFSVGSLDPNPIHPCVYCRYIYI